MKRSQQVVMLATVATMALMLGCASAPSRNQQTWEPGMHSFNLWNYTRADIDINGEVGHPLDVTGPTAACIKADGSRGVWRAKAPNYFLVKVKSGTLPPGLFVNYETDDTEKGHIRGIPKERGHWIVRMQVVDVDCDGKTYKGGDQELRFHITGSGKVIN